MWRNIGIAAALVLVVIAGVPLLTSAKWIGHFTLTIDLDVAAEIDAASISYFESWNRGVAQEICNNLSDGIAEFEPPAERTANTHTVVVTCSGDSGAFGLIDTYYQPELLVVQYRFKDAPAESFARKLLPIPAGRGARRTTLTLP